MKREKDKKTRKKDMKIFNPGWKGANRVNVATKKQQQSTQTTTAAAAKRATCQRQPSSK
jgi:hypothetical protein